MTNKQPLVSVVTPTFNSAAFLAEHLDSVGSQTYPNIEHVFVDGGSTDDTVELIKQYAKTHNVTWISEPDGGTADATSKGLRMASGDITVILPSDDLLFPWSVQTAVEYLEKHPDVDVVHGDSLRLEESRDELILRLHKPYSFGYVARTECLTPQATFFRRRAIEGNEHLEPGLRHACDYEWVLRVIQGRRVRNIREVLAVVRKREGAVNRESGVARAMAKETAQIRKRYLNPRNPLNSLLRWWDRISAAAWRRYLLIRMLMLSVRRNSANGDGEGPWARFLQTHSVTAPSKSVWSLFFPRRTYGVHVCRRESRSAR